MDDPLQGKDNPSVLFVEVTVLSMQAIIVVQQFCQRISGLVPKSGTNEIRVLVGFSFNRKELKTCLNKVYTGTDYICLDAG